MGKQQSKAQCFILNPNLSQTPMDKVWEEKSKFDWTNCNLDETLSELSISLEDATASSPLRVDLPPPKPETETSKVLKLDHLTTNQNDNTKGSESKFNLEKFECGVQFESSENAKQEWSFTLYNFDGHGGITKEDLASLLRALYDAVGSSIKLPPKGVKTLKLHLSVGQDSAAELKAVAKPESRERSRNTNNLEKAGRNKVKDFSKLNNFKWTSVKCTNEKLPGVKDTCLSPVPEQQQLAELVMENMERNQIRQLRRHHENHHHHKHGHQNSSHCPVTIATTGEYGVNLGQKIDQAEEQPKESQDRRNYYLDLAGVENLSPKFQNNPTVPVAGSGYVHSRRETQRSRPHNITKCDNLHSVANKCDKFPIMCTDKRDNVTKETERLRCKQSNGERRSKYRQCHEPRSKSFDLHRVPKKNRPLSAPQHQQRQKELNSKCFQPVDSHAAHDLLTISPHHHRKHGHREKDHDLAMKQVAQWIKREHAAHLARDQPIIQRHEHRHVHEHHHHHHYHHYHET